jgi:hypothetical protein
MIKRPRPPTISTELPATIPNAKPATTQPEGNSPSVVAYSYVSINTATTGGTDPFLDHSAKTPPFHPQVSPIRNLHTLLASPKPEPATGGTDNSSPTPILGPRKGCAQQAKPYPHLSEADTPATTTTELSSEKSEDPVEEPRGCTVNNCLVS